MFYIIISPNIPNMIFLSEEDRNKYVNVLRSFGGTYQLAEVKFAHDDMDDLMTKCADRYQKEKEQQNLLISHYDAERARINKYGIRYEIQGSRPTMKTNMETEMENWETKCAEKKRKEEEMDAAFTRANADDYDPTPNFIKRVQGTIDFVEQAIKEREEQ